MNNASNNGNQQRGKREKPIRVSRGWKNYVEDSIFEEEEPYEEEFDCESLQNNHDYQVKTDVPLFYRTIGVEEFLGRQVDVNGLFDIIGVLENKQVKMIAITLTSNDVVL